MLNKFEHYYSFSVDNNDYIHMFSTAEDHGYWMHKMVPMLVELVQGIDVMVV